MRIALFDLDGTLLDGDTDALWCEFLMAEGVLDRQAFEAGNRAARERYAQGAISAADFSAFYAATLAGRAPAEWLPLRERFVAAAIEPRLGPGARALVARHRRAGDRLVLTTATNRFLTEPIAASLGIADLIATELEIEGGLFTGRTAGVLNMREGKVLRLAEWLKAQGLADVVLAEATFYSDSINDLPLLRAVGSAVAIEPDPNLQAEARLAGWPVLRLRR